MNIKGSIIDLYIKKHNSCGGCQSRWSGIRDTFNIKNAPEFLQRRAKYSVNANKLMNTLFKDK